MIMRVEHLEEHGVTGEELQKALAPIWRELDRVLAQLGMHRS
jgi:hypothetical protein